MIHLLRMVCFTAAACVAIAIGWPSVGAGGDLEDGDEAYGRRDFAIAIGKYQLAAERGDAIAQYNLGRMYHDGKGVERDFERAVHWYTKAAERGNADAQFWAGLMYRDAIGVSRDYGKAFYWLARSGSRGNISAQFAMGQIYYHALGHSPDWVKAYAWFTLAWQQGDLEAKEMMDRLEKDLSPGQVRDARQFAKDLASGRITTGR